MSTRILVIFTLCWLCNLHGQETPFTLESAETRYQEELKKLTEERDKRDQALVQNYLGELLRYEARARNSSDLDGVLAARGEVARVENEGVQPPAAPSPDTEVARLQEMMLEQSRRHARMKGERLLELLEGITRFAGTQSMEHTRRNDIPGAIAWRDWAQNLQQRPEALRAKGHSETSGGPSGGPGDAETLPTLHSSPVAEVHARPVEDFVDQPRAFVLGNEPKGKETRQNESTPSAAGSGHTLLQARLRLVDEEDTLNRYNTPWSSFRLRSHLYVPRLQFTPLPGRNMGESLVVFDLFKRGSGANREIIRTDSLRLPPVPAGAQVVIDAGVYAYQSERYRASYAGGHRGEQASADLFHGFIVTIFDRQGRMLFQRSNDRGLNAFARTEPPPLPPPPPPE